MRERRILLLHALQFGHAFLGGTGAQQGQAVVQAVPGVARVERDGLGEFGGGLPVRGRVFVERFPEISNGGEAVRIHGGTLAE